MDRSPTQSLWDYFFKQVAPSVLLVCRDRDMKRMLSTKTLTLVNPASWHVEHIPWLYNLVDFWFSFDFIWVVVTRGRSW